MPRPLFSGFSTTSSCRAGEQISYLQHSQGISYQVFALEPSRANLVARLKGNGRKKPVLILGHTDTVGVQPEVWPVDPFGALRKDGYIWGRGTTDNKDCVAAGLILMLQLKRLRVPLDRDVIYVAEAGEESSSGCVANRKSVRLPGMTK